MKEEFDYKAGTFPGTAEWLEDLETAGPDAVFAALSQSSSGAGGDVLLGRSGRMTKGFAERWHAFKMRQKAAREDSRLKKQLWISSLAVATSALSAMAAIASATMAYWK